MVYWDNFVIEYTRRNRNQILKYFRPFYQGLKWVRIMEKMEAENLVTNFLGLDPTCCVILHNPNLQFNPTNLPYTYNPIIQPFHTILSYSTPLSSNSVLQSYPTYNHILQSYPTIISYNLILQSCTTLSNNPVLQPYPIIISYNRNIVQPYPTILSYCTILSNNLYNPIQ